METLLLAGQSLLDISVQESGSLESIFSLANENDVSITDEVPVGTSLQVIEVKERQNKQIASYYKTNNLKPATELGFYIEEGIEFWEIEYDFIVS